MSEEDLKALRAAAATLEHPSLAARLGNIAGKPIELVGRALPEAASEAIAAFLLAVAVGSLIAFCWFCWWFAFFADIELAIGKEARWRLIHPTLYGLRERGHVKFGVLQNRKPDQSAVAFFRRNEPRVPGD